MIQLMELFFTSTKALIVNELLQQFCQSLWLLKRQTVTTVLKYFRNVDALRRRLHLLLDQCTKESGIVSSLFWSSSSSLRQNSSWKEFLTLVLPQS